jgi:KRAB domain-containing zinc finger protein
MKPDIDSLESKAQPESRETDKIVDSHEKRKFLRNPSRFIKCSMCSETFTGPSRLILHAKQAHNDLKPFKCSHGSCDKSYQNPKALKVHRKLHGTDLPFKCDECQSAFHVKANFQAHMRLHTGEKFTCDVENCGKSFTSSNYLKQHRILHTYSDHNIPLPYKCGFIDCPREFADKNALRSHQMVHGEKNFNCETCGSKFRTNSALKIHHLKHIEPTMPNESSSASSAPRSSSRRHCCLRTCRPI